MIELKGIEIKDRTPIYKQMIDYFESAIIKGSLKPGIALPSISQLAKKTDVSKETVNKVYRILTKRGLLESHQGKGFFVRSRSKTSNLKIIILTDNLSTFRKAFLDSFSEALGNSSEVHIVLHNKDVGLLEYYLDQSLGRYDYYIITPHFPRDIETTEAVIKQLSRIPARHLILADKMVESLQGEFGAAFQDYAQDISDALSEAIDDIRKYPCLEVFTMPGSLYGDLVELSIARFCDRNGIHASFHSGISESDIHKGQLCFIYDQDDQALFSLHEKTEKERLVVGKDLKVIFFNDTPLCRILFGGLTTISTDFKQMGILCAKMILEGELTKVKCNCILTRRHTF